MDLLANQWNGWMMFAGLALMLVILFRRYARYYRKLKRGQNKSPATASRRNDQGIPGQNLADAPSDLLRWQVEMHDIARELKAELDTKIGLLQATVQLADAKIAELSSLVERARNCSESDATTDASNPNLEMSQPIVQAASRAATESQQVVDESRALLEATSAPTSHSTSGMGLPGSEDMRRSVYQLADRGLTSLQISQETGRAHGDIEFILALRTTE